jgi:hypothetical protein
VLNDISEALPELALFAAAAAGHPLASGTPGFYWRWQLLSTCCASMVFPRRHRQRRQMFWADPIFLASPSIQRHLKPPSPRQSCWPVP